jgi:hypothetical protein
MGQRTGNPHPPHVPSRPPHTHLPHPSQIIVVKIISYLLVITPKARVFTSTWLPDFLLVFLQRVLIN